MSLKMKMFYLPPLLRGYYDYKKDQYIYQYKDHLGNVRVSFGRNDAGVLEITDANDYYPFGMNHLKTGNAFFGVGSYQNDKYNGKELQETGMYDYCARMYMPDIGRWGVHDPLSNLQFAYSPYSYFYGNPIRFNDPTGMIGEEDPPKKGSTPNNPIEIGEIKLIKNVSDSKLSFMGIQSLSAYHGSQDRLAFGIRNSKAALATEKFERNLALTMGTFLMGGSNLVASAGCSRINEIIIMENITEKIKSVLLHDGNWKFSDFYLNVELLKNIDIQISFWEDEENWATLLSNNIIIGYLWKECPLLIIEKNYENIVHLNKNQFPFLCTIIVENLDDKNLKLDYNILKNQLLDWEINYHIFSANDLWFNTNSI